MGGCQCFLQGRGYLRCLPALPHPPPSCWVARWPETGSPSGCSCNTWKRRRREIISQAWRGQPQTQIWRESRKEVGDAQASAGPTKGGGKDPVTPPAPSSNAEVTLRDPPTPFPHSRDSFTPSVVHSGGTYCTQAFGGQVGLGVENTNKTNGSCTSVRDVADTDVLQGPTCFQITAFR